MEYIELSIEDTKEKCAKLYDDIKKEYNYDLVIFIAKGSFLIGEELAKLNNVDMLEIFATRRGNKLKKYLKKSIKFIPKKVLIYFRKKEMNNDYHEKNSDRNIKYDKNLYSKYRKKRRILLVDDSIDSGNTIILVKKELENYFVDSQIRIAVFNTMSKSGFIPDYSIYKNTMICGPWSMDSKYNKVHMEKYKEWVGSEK